jgi:hypothetical protein
MARLDTILRQPFWIFNVPQHEAASGMDDLIAGAPTLQAALALARGTSETALIFEKDTGKEWEFITDADFNLLRDAELLLAANPDDPLDTLNSPDNDIVATHKLAKSE